MSDTAAVSITWLFLKATHALIEVSLCELDPCTGASVLLDPSLIFASTANKQNTDQCSWSELQIIYNWAQKLACKSRCGIATPATKYGKFCNQSIHWNNSNTETTVTATECGKICSNETSWCNLDSTCHWMQEILQVQPNQLLKLQQHPQLTKYYCNCNYSNTFI